MKSANPITGAEFPSLPEHTPEAVEAALAASAAAFHSWRRTHLAARAELFSRLSAEILADAETTAQLITEEMGKPLKESRGEVNKAAATCRYFAENLERFLSPETVEMPGGEAEVVFEPLGTILGIFPWNFPFFQAIRFSVPTIAAGNAVLMKPAPLVPRVAQQVEAAFQRAGFPKGVFAQLRLSDDRVRAIIEDSRVCGVGLTGSPRAGRAVAAIAGGVLKKAVLELGGSDPYVVLADADLEVALEETLKSRLVNGGQSCIGAKRCIVIESVADTFEQRLKERLSKLKVGDPREADTDVGPMARGDLRAELHRQVEASVRAGARLELGGRLPDGPGFFYPLTLLTGVKPGMPAFDQELFGPVFSVIRAPSEEQALSLANQTEYGLGAAVFTQDLAKGRRWAREELHAGSCFVNAFVRSDARLPFGGVKNSGFGRELSRFGLLEFVNVKSVFVGGG